MKITYLFLLGNIFIPIGGYFTMNQEEVVEALHIIQPNISIPLHCNTFPHIRADPLESKKIAENDGLTVKVFNFGESREI